MSKHSLIATALSIIFFVSQPGVIEGYYFYRDLHLGDKGEDVKALQIELNKNTATQLTTFGPGSAGQETGVFGPLTESAVKRYQEGYAQEVLNPIGLTQGTGFVGMATRNKLNNTGSSVYKTALTPIEPKRKTFMELYQEQAQKNKNPVRQFQPTPMTSEEFQARNMQNADMFINGIKQKNTTLSESEIQYFEEAVRNQAATTTDIREIFIETRNKMGISNMRTVEELESEGIRLQKEAKEAKEAKENKSLSLGFFPGLFEKALTVLQPQKAHAYAIGVPFGGPIVFVFFCACSGTWLVAIGSPSVGYYDYESGTQFFESYNMPFTPMLLGYYLPMVPLCWIPIPAPVPCPGFTPGTFGLIYGFVGSAAI